MNAKIVDIDDPRLVKALAHPIRMKILTILEDRTATPKELAEMLGLPLENVSYHVRTLKDFGFIKLEKTRQVRGAVEHHYKLAGRPRIGAKLWAETPRILQEAFSDAQLSVIVEQLAQAAMQGGFDVAEAHAVNHSLVLDAEALDAASKLLSETYDQLEQMSQAAQGRANDDARRVTLTALLFETPKAMPPEAATQKREARARSRTPKSTA
jgi:DNA-binding transcriptional ArsR family regulator